MVGEVLFRHAGVEQTEGVVVVHSDQKFPPNGTNPRGSKNSAQMELVQDLQGLWGKRTVSVLSARVEFVVQSNKMDWIRYFLPKGVFKSSHCGSPGDVHYARVGLPGPTSLPRRPPAVR